MMKKSMHSRFLSYALVFFAPYLLSYLNSQTNIYLDNSYWSLLRFGISNVYISGFCVWIFASLLLLCDYFEIQVVKKRKVQIPFVRIHVSHIVIYVLLVVVKLFAGVKAKGILYLILASYHSAFSYMFAMNTVMMIMVLVHISNTQSSQV